MARTEICRLTVEKKLNVLVNAYAVSPSWGSEPGMGWNWIVNLARHCKVHVITEGEWREEIEKALPLLPQKENIRFHYLPVSEKVRHRCWNQGDWRFYFHYAAWQKRALAEARKIIASTPIDVMHQLNMIGFREPGYLYKIKDIPLVWGPVGGMVRIPLSFLKGAGWKLNLFFRIKNTVSRAQLRWHPRVRKMVKRSCMLAASSDTVKSMKEVYGLDVPLMNETGVYLHKNTSPENVTVNTGAETRTVGHPLELLWVGKFDFRKQLGTALQTVAACRDVDVRLTVAGDGSEEENDRYRNMAEELGIADRVVWLGKVPHERIRHLMLASDLFFFTSISEATSTVVLEAIECGLPVLSMNANGFGPLVRDFAGVAIDATDTAGAVEGFADAIRHVARNPKHLREISERELANLKSLSWPEKGLKVYELYKQSVDALYLNGGGISILASDRFRVLWVGKFDFTKQLALSLRVIAAMRSLNAAMYVCGGSTAEAEEWGKRVAGTDMKGRVLFEGPVPHGMMKAIMQRAGVMLFPSISEGTPHVILEAMEAGLPVVCLDMCGQGDVVSAGCGIKLPVSGPGEAVEGMASALDMIAGHPGLREELSAGCRAELQRNEWGSKSKAVADTYLRAVMRLR